MRLPLLASLLAFAACGGEVQREAAAYEPAPSRTPTPGLPDVDPDPETDAGPAIPARFLGVWDAETGTCDPASDLRLEIAPQSIGFYESLGTVTAVTERKNGSVVIGLAMEGEGEKWEQTITLELIRSGNTEWLLSLPGRDSDITLRPIRLKRCPS